VRHPRSDPVPTSNRRQNALTFAVYLNMAFDPKARSPTLKKLIKSRLAPIRETELITKALCPDKPLKPPADGRECCGSACKPCVMDLYGEELRVWKECWVLWEDEKMKDSAITIEEKTMNEGVSKQDQGATQKMPGSFDW
jgi:hypothetical protein